MKFKKYFNVDAINEMANISEIKSGIKDVKFNIRQPGNEKYQHDISVKIFKKKNINNAMIVSINRNVNTLVVQRDVKYFTKKEKKRIMNFIQKNMLNFINLWDDQTLSIDELNWVKR